MGQYTNADGLTIYFGQDENYQRAEGEYRVDGLFRQEEFVLDLATLTNTDQIVTQQIFPWGKDLFQVRTIVDTPATGGGTLDVGFRNLRTGAAIAAQGAVAALPTASLATEGATSILTAGSTYAGTLVGKIVNNTKYTVIGITAKYNTTAFTAGRVRFQLSWYKKGGSGNTGL